MDTLQLTAQAVARIDELLKAKGWSRAELGRRTGIDPPHITRLMKAESPTSLDTLTKVANALEVHVADLIQPAVKLYKVKPAKPGTGRMIPDLGKVSAGVALDPKAEPHAYEEVWGLPASGGEFVIFTVSGDSMEDAHILNGDRVIIRLQPEADSGENVVCQIDGKLLLKEFRRSAARGCQLIPHNDWCEVIDLDDAEDPRIIGVLYEVRRKPKLNRRLPKGKK